MIWSCPLCRGSLNTFSDTRWSCSHCSEEYSVLAGIPDFRVGEECWIDKEQDLKAAKELYEFSVNSSLEDVVRWVFSRREGWSMADIELRTRQTLAAVERRRPDIRSWLKSAMHEGELFLDLGCGGGALIAAAAKEGYRGIGIDASMELLILARKMILEAGGEPVLAAAMAEKLPIADQTLAGLISLDVIEHVGDIDSYLQEINRVLKPGRGVILTTPNRFSLTPEPHVQVWGVGLLPRSLQKKYVYNMSGKKYDYCQLMSRWELARKIKANTTLDYSIGPGVIAASEIQQFKPLKAKLARIYNRLISFSLIRYLYQIIGPFFVVQGYRLP